MGTVGWSLYLPSFGDHWRGASVLNFVATVANLQLGCHNFSNNDKLAGTATTRFDRKKNPQFTHVARGKTPFFFSHINTHTHTRYDTHQGLGGKSQ